jgi:hypothetical protein
MAKGKIFIGEIMADMVTALGSIDDTMLSQITKIDEQIAELQTINTTVAQTVTSGNLESGTENIISITHTEKSSSVGSPTEICRFKSFALGKVNLSAMLQCSHNYNYAKLKYSKDGGTTKIQIGSAVGSPAVTWALVQGDINVAIGDEVILYVAIDDAGGYTVKAQANSAKASYNLLNLSTDGYFVKV